MSQILSLLKDFDIAGFLPEMDTFVIQLAGWLRLFLLAGPLALVVLGYWYKKAPQKEANYQYGYRSKYSMVSQATWEYAQKLASQRFLRLGVILSVVMLVISLFFGIMDPLVMAVIALLCGLVEAWLILALHIGIDKQLQAKFDRHGFPRRK